MGLYFVVCSHFACLTKLLFRSDDTRCNGTQERFCAKHDKPVAPCFLFRPAAPAGGGAEKRQK